ncbi:hypothetical protein [Jiangella mangrovi]|uniref:F5/8 type C domain-containing protein n=1 Tax=Jiangella mangrovi TaxID=1524084 RepID=A0A7W9GP62_9ACTN|nr:hypothetical protein [Jiangella mangrovi]MBB5787238.1 hypothetical protein [Jiangella mangrovi]
MSRSSRTVAVATAVVVAGAVVASAVQAPSPGQAHVRLPAGQTFHSVSSGYAAFPAAFNAGVTNADGTHDPHLFVSYGKGPDSEGDNTTVMLESGDEGTTWTPVEDSPTYGIVNAVRLADAAGTIVALDYEPLAISDPAGHAGDPVPSTPHNENLSRFIRWTLGPTGWDEAGTVTTAFPGYPAPAVVRFQKGILLQPDGETLLATVYGSDVGGTYFTGVMRSTDDGLTWTQIARIGTGAIFSEANLAPTSDGRVMAWMRRDIDDGTYLPDLYYTYSANENGDGPWSTPVRMSQDTGNSPGAVLLGNGAAVQGSGRPGNVIRYKYTGTSGYADWTGRTNIYDNTPTTSVGTPPRPLAALGSSATVALTPLTGNTVLAIGDNCAGNWGCPTSNVSGYPRGTGQSLWKSVLEVNTSQWGTIDLRSKFERGEISYVAPSFTTYGRGRTSLGAYAFDGDVRADSSVVTTNRSVTLQLDREYLLTGFAIAAHLGGSDDVTIQTSTNGSNWSTPARGTRVGSLRPLTTPTAARYVRISDPNLTTSDGSSFLNELQIYSMLDGYEASAPGVEPVGNGVIASTTTGATVVPATSVPAVDDISSRFLRLVDPGADGYARIQWNHGTSTAATFEFRARATGTATRTLVFGILGTATGGAAVTPYHFMLDAVSGRFHRYDAATGTWGAPLGTAGVGGSWNWNTITVEATATGATLRANGTTIATVAPSQPFTAMTGSQLGSGGTEPTGDNWLFDDVGYTRP